MRRRLALIGLAAFALTAAAVPAIGAGWTPSPGATVVTDSSMGKTDVAVGVSANGDAIGLWSESNTIEGQGATALKASVRHNGTWGAPETIDNGLGHQSVNDAKVVLDDNGFATAVWVRRNPDFSKRLWFATRPASGPWSAPTEVSTGLSAESLDVAISPNGHVTASWQSPTGGGVWAADKVAGATTWTLTQVSASGGSPSVAAAPDNRMAIAWGTSGGLLKVKVRTGTGSWADVATETASTDREETAFVDGASEPVLAFGLDNALHAAWWEYDDGEAPTLEQVRTSSRSTGGEWTVKPDPISTDEHIMRPSGIAGDAQGNVTVVFYSQTVTADNVYYAASRVGGTWETPHPLTGADPIDFGSTPSLVLKPDGMFTAAWVQDDQIKANRRTAGGDWLQAAENISAQSVSFYAVTSDSSGEPMVLWERSSFESSVFHNRIETRTYDSSAPPGDTEGPVTTMVLPTKPYYLSAGIPVQWEAVDPQGSPLDGSRLRVRSGAWNGEFPTQYTNLTTFGTGTSLVHLAEPGRTYCFGAQSRDDIPNVGEWSADACTATPVDDRTPVRAGTWKKLSDAKFYRGTALKSIDKGATLTLSGAQGKRFALVVTKGPGFGKVSVKFAGELLKTVSLAAQTSKHRVVVPLALFGDVRGGKLVVKVVSADGKKVQVDGILVGRL